MNLVLLFPEDFTGEENRVALTGRRLKHIVEVHRAKKGDTLSVGLVGEKIGVGKIVSIHERVLEMDVFFTDNPPSPIPLILIIALPRPKMLKRLLKSITSLGVKKIVIIHAQRVEKSFWQTLALTEESITRQLVLGLEQAKDTRMPHVITRSLFKPFVEDELPSLIQGTVPLVAHPLSKDSCPGSIDGPITLAIGPEGGFIPYEVGKLEEAGFKSFHFGDRILPVETVVPALVSKLFY